MSTKQHEAQSSVHPVVQAHRMEQAALAQRVADILRDNDTTRMGLPPEPLALIAGGPLACWDDAQRVALAVAGLIERAGLADVARVWYDAQRRTVGDDAWHAHERAGRVLARRVVEAMVRETEDATDGE